MALSIDFVPSANCVVPCDEGVAPTSGGGNADANFIFSRTAVSSTSGPILCIYTTNLLPLESLKQKIKMPPVIKMRDCKSSMCLHMVPEEVPLQVKLEAK